MTVYRYQRHILEEEDCKPDERSAMRGQGALFSRGAALESAFFFGTVHRRGPPFFQLRSGRWHSALRPDRARASDRERITTQTNLAALLYSGSGAPGPGAPPLCSARIDICAV